MEQVHRSRLFGTGVPNPAFSWKETWKASLQTFFKAMQCCLSHHSAHNLLGLAFRSVPSKCTAIALKAATSAESRCKSRLCYGHVRRPQKQFWPYNAVWVVYTSQLPAGNCFLFSNMLPPASSGCIPSSKLRSAALWAEGSQLPASSSLPNLPQGSRDPAGARSSLRHLTPASSAVTPSL